MPQGTPSTKCTRDFEAERSRLSRALLTWLSGGWPKLAQKSARSASVINGYRQSAALAVVAFTATTLVGGTGPDGILLALEGMRLF